MPAAISLFSIHFTFIIRKNYNINLQSKQFNFVFFFLIMFKSKMYFRAIKYFKYSRYYKKMYFKENYEAKIIEKNSVIYF